MLTPDLFCGDGGDQAMAYMQQLINRAKKRKLSEKRGKGKPPSSEHYAAANAKMKLLNPDESRVDPSYFPHPPLDSLKKSKGRGKSTRGRGRGRGARNQSSSSFQGSVSQVAQQNQLNQQESMSTDSTDLSPSKGVHWRPDELSALIKGANHLKPVLKGRFRHATDGVVLKELAWQELRGTKIILFTISHQCSKIIRTS